MNTSQEKIEILSVELLNQRRPQVEALKRLAGSLGLDFGWHYLLDLTWILDHLGPARRQRILDAGAGTGILQWHLAEEGAEVLSVDRGDRRNLPLRFRRRFRHAVRIEHKNIARLKFRLVLFQAKSEIPIFQNSQNRSKRVKVFDGGLGMLVKYGGIMPCVGIAQPSFFHRV